MISFPPCKINLGLHVIAKRPDGYHEIETCFYPVQWTDILEIIPSNDVSFTSSGLFIPGPAEDNLCLKAYHLLKTDFNLAPVKIHLHKILPTGAGLGGGSADAAHTLRLLNSIFSLELSTAQLSSYAARLGSDCSFFVYDKPMLGKGRGELLSPVAVNLKGKFIVLVNPGIHVSTAAAYAGVSPVRPQTTLEEILTQVPLVHWRHELKNDFEKSVFKLHPAIQKIKETLYAQGAQYACMSGSGSTVFAIFEQEVDLKNCFTDCQYWSGILS